LRVNAEAPEPDLIDRAAELLRLGGLVAFPTETVYGLGANAFDTDAVAGIFKAKGRPANNPLIVHVADAESAMHLASNWPDAAATLAERFWPGPLTLVLPRTSAVPDIVTGGGGTVALRSPAHPVARALLERTGFPLAAPSANLSEHLSPTTAEHVLQDLDGHIAMVLDSGATSGGIESTVLALSGPVPVLLRPGLISHTEIEAVIGPIVRMQVQSDSTTPAPSPGMNARHYAPRALLQISESSPELVTALVGSGERVGWLALHTAAVVVDNSGGSRRLVIVQMPQNAAGYASALYARLHELDALGVTRIVVDNLPESEEWMAIRDRLSRASTH